MLILQEAVVVNEYMNKHGVINLWTGGQDHDGDGQFTWIGNRVFPKQHKSDISGIFVQN